MGWAEHYIDYKILKTILKQGPGDATKAEFFEKYEGEIDKCNVFYLAKVKEFEEAMTTFEVGGFPIAGADSNAKLVSFLNLFKEMGEMQTYCWINAQGFRKAMKKYDKNMGLRKTGTEMTEEMDAKLSKEPF